MKFSSLVPDDDASLVLDTMKTESDTYEATEHVVLLYGRQYTKSSKIVVLYTILPNLEFVLKFAWFRRFKMVSFRRT